MTHADDVPHQIEHAFFIIAEDTVLSRKKVVDSDQGNFALHEILDLGVIKIYAQNANAVYIAVTAMIQIGKRLASDVMIDQGNVVAPALRLTLESIEYNDEIGVQEAVLQIIVQNYAEVEGAVGLQPPGNRVGMIADLTRGFQHPLACFLADIRVIVQRLGDRRYGKPAVLG